MAEQDEKRIRERAYRIWQEEGAPDGQADDHWHRACRELDDEDRAAASDPGAIEFGADESLADEAGAEGAPADDASAMTGGEAPDPGESKINSGGRPTVDELTAEEATAATIEKGGRASAGQGRTQRRPPL
ncbi:DUF2934 domain-containing protein [Faunimonas sp. B44]|uniref:DUF2934 domain-containing protein n=1 Tax=Faunimonas sp. B44 TaxID=3461493 RepID=UPI0040444B9B